MRVTCLLLLLFVISNAEHDIVYKNHNDVAQVDNYESEKSKYINVFEKIDRLEKQIAFLSSEEGLLQLLNKVFDSPPSYFQSFIINLSKRKYDTRQVAQKIKKWGT